jgi:hypothetical protein
MTSILLELLPGWYDHRVVFERERIAALPRSGSLSRYAPA